MLIERGILQSSICKGKGSLCICPPDYDKLHWSKQFWISPKEKIILERKIIPEIEIISVNCFVNKEDMNIKEVMVPQNNVLIPNLESKIDNLRNIVDPTENREEVVNIKTETDIIILPVINPSIIILPIDHTNTKNDSLLKTNLNSFIVV